jgi:hypothetical protein
MEELKGFSRRLWAMAPSPYSMPVRSYFLVIGPSLAACLWFMNSFLEPAPPLQARSTGPAQAAKPSLASPAQAASPVLVTAARAAPQPLPQLQDRAPADGTKPADETKPTSAEVQPAEGTRSSHPPDATSRAAEVAKPKKRKQTAQRRPHRDGYGPAFTERSPYPAYASSSPYYAPSQPFYGYRSW